MKLTRQNLLKVEIADIAHVDRLIAIVYTANCAAAIQRRHAESKH